MRLFYRLLVSIAYCGIFVYCQRGSPSGIKGGKPGIGSSGSANFGNSNSKSCKGAGCKNTDIIVLSTVGGFGGIMTLLTMICYCYKHQMRRIANRNTVILEEKKKNSKKNTPCDMSVFKSGSWSTRYLQFGVWFGPDCVSLSFDLISFKINGSGADDVGTYTINGSYSIEDGRMILIKKYQLGTGDPSGNLGHRVLIRLAWNPETCQFEGNWFVRTKLYCGLDKFELKFNEPPKLWMTSTAQ